MTEPAPNTRRPSVTLQDEGPYWITPNGPDQRLIATVLVPAFNGAATLERALTSARDQTLTDLEIIVIDDASTDGTWEIIETMLDAEPRLRAIRNKQNCGKPVSMNRAMRHARGRWLAVLDADDWYHPERLARLIALAESAGAQMAADNQLFYDTIADRFVGSAWVVADRHRPLTLDTYLARSDAYERFSLGMLKPIFDAGFIRDRGVEYESDARNGQDFFKLLCFFLAGGTAVTTDIPYYCYTQPYGTSSRRWSHEARKRYNFQLAYTINQRYLTEQRHKLTPSQFRSLERRSRQLRTLEHFHRLREALARRDVRNTASSVAAQPAVIAYCARQLWHRWRRAFGSATGASEATALPAPASPVDIAPERSQPTA